MAFDVGLLSPLAVGNDEIVSDRSILDALVTTEVALSRAWAKLGASDAAAVISITLGWHGPQTMCTTHGVDIAELVKAAVAGGNPVIPLVGRLRALVPVEARAWVHRGATSQDIMDTALMLVSREAIGRLVASLRSAEARLAVLADRERARTAVARASTQHAVPTTIGVRAANWLQALTRARVELEQLLPVIPVQLAGAGGTLASFVELGGLDIARHLPGAFARELHLAAPEAPWHVSRWPVTRIADAVARAVDATGKVATDLATLSRTEIAEVGEDAPEGRGTRAWNPVDAVLVRSAAMRAPQLSATVHLAAALAGDERSDGPWHAEWPALRELLRVALGASATLDRLVGEMRIDVDAVTRNLEITGGLIVAERLSISLAPVLGKNAVGQIVVAAGAGGDLHDLLVEALENAVDRTPGMPHPADRVAELLDPDNYTGLADDIVAHAIAGSARPDPGAGDAEALAVDEQ